MSEHFRSGLEYGLVIFGFGGIVLLGIYLSNQEFFSRLFSRPEAPVPPPFAEFIENELDMSRLPPSKDPPPR